MFVTWRKHQSTLLASASLSKISSEKECEPVGSNSKFDPRNPRKYILAFNVQSIIRTDGWIQNSSKNTVVQWHYCSTTCIVTLKKILGQKVNFIALLLHHMNSDSQKNFGAKSQCKNFHGGTYVTYILKSPRDSVTQHVWVYPEKFNIDIGPQIFSWLPHTYSDSQKICETKTQCKIFQGTLRGGHF